MVRANPPSSWNIGLDAWIIQDGNYPDFATGEIVEFAVEFWRQPRAAAELQNSSVSATHMNGVAYDVIAKPVLETDEITVLDIGILCYREGTSHFAELKPRIHFRTVLELGVDPFFYFERLSQIRDVPPLIYSWRVTSILRQVAPFVEIVSNSGPHAGRKMLVRDVSKLGYEEISRTNAWEDDSGFGEYILRCDLLSIDPKRVSGTAT
jgi:hypothetical protein